MDTTIDLSEVIRELWKSRWLVVLVTMLFATGSAVYAFLATPVYRVEVVLAPNRLDSGDSLSAGLGPIARLAGISIDNPGSVQHALATFRSQAFIERFIQDKNLLPVLFAEKWSASEQRWKGSPEEWPDLRAGVSLFVGRIRTITEDSNTKLVTLRIDWTDPNVATSWAELLASQINEELREGALADSTRRLEYLRQTLGNTQVIELRQAISGLIEEQMRAMMLAQAKGEYAFKVIDPARTPKAKFSPQRALIVVVGLITGGIFGLLIVLLRRSLRNLMSPA